MFLGSEGPTFFQIRALFFGLGQKPKNFSKKFQSTKKIFSCLIEKKFFSKKLIFGVFSQRPKNCCFLQANEELEVVKHGT